MKWKVNGWLENVKQVVGLVFSVWEIVSYICSVQVHTSYSPDFNLFVIEVKGECMVKKC